LRYPPGYEVPGFHAVGSDDWPDSAEGPTIVPGSYGVVLQYGTQTLREPLTLRLDPRIHPGEGDLAARLAFALKIQQAIDRLDRAIAAALAVQGKLPAATRAQVNATLADLIQLDIHSSEGDLLHPLKVREQLGFLLNSLDPAYQRPTAAEYATYDDLEALAVTGEARLAQLTH